MNNTEREPGFAEVMQNMAFNPTTPFKALPSIGELSKRGEEEEEPDKSAIQLVFHDSAADNIRELCKELGAANPATLLSTALSIYAQMARAEKEGYSTLVLLNEQTQDLISIKLTNDV